MFEMIKKFFDFCDKKNRNKLCTRKTNQEVDLVAQQVEHHTFNVGVLGSSPSQVTEKRKSSIDDGRFRIFFIFIFFIIEKS